MIKERVKNNETSFWDDGPLNKAHLIANDADQVGLQAVWSANYPEGIWHGGMTLWYASSDTTFQQYGWNYGDDSWTKQEEFKDLNGDAGVACYTWESDSSVMYVMFVNTEDTVEFWWKDTNTSVSSTEAHPIGRWTKCKSAKSSGRGMYCC